MENEIEKLKRHPGYWWNYLLIWLLSKNILDTKIINKLLWRIKKK
jgi:hypothetical protein